MTKSFCDICGATLKDHEYEGVPAYEFNGLRVVVDAVESPEKVEHICDHCLREAVIRGTRVTENEGVYQP